MAEQPELPSLPEVPEVPGAVIWGRYIWHVIISDLAMIRKVWRTIIIISLVFSATTYFFDKNRYEDRLGAIILFCG